MLIARKIAAISLIAGTCFAQAPARKFEVASIKPADPNQNRVSIQITPGGRWVANAVTVSFLIQQAYGIRDFQIIGAPDWIRSLRWEVNAKPEDGSQVDQNSIKMMLQSLLADRFGMAFTRGTKEMPVYDLVAAKGGLKLKESEAPAGGNGPQGVFRVGRGLISLKGATLSQLAVQLSNLLGRPVNEKTGSPTLYDIELKYSPDFAQQTGGLAGSPTSSAPVDSDGPTIFTALLEAGLKLDSAKGPVDVFTIDKIEKPSEN